MNEAFELGRRASKLDDLRRALHVQRLGDLVVDAHVAHVRDVVDAVDLPRQLSELGARQSEIDRCRVAFDHRDAGALVRREALDLGPGLNLELGEDDEVDERRCLQGEDGFQHFLAWNEGKPVMRTTSS